MIKDIGIPLFTFLMGLLVQFLYAQHQSKKEALLAIQSELKDLIAYAESNSNHIYGTKFRYNLIYQNIEKFCRKYHFDVDMKNLETPLSDLSIACTNSVVNLELATNAVIAIMKEINKAA